MVCVWIERSNRTFMELKFAFYQSEHIPKAGSNRTFMELKLQQRCFGFLPVACSNRTFMELKSCCVRPSTQL